MTEYLSRHRDIEAQVALSAIAQRRARPQLQNTDGDPLCLVKAKPLLNDPDEVERELIEHPDIEREKDALTWWGRPLSEMERETTLARLRSQLKENGEELELLDPEGPKRRLRGRLHRRVDGFEVEVNSKERGRRSLDVAPDRSLRLARLRVISACRALDAEV